MAARSFPVIYSAHVERCAAFYAALGFERRFQLPPEGPADYVTLARGAAELGIVAAEWPAQQLGIAIGSDPRFELFVYVDELDAEVQRVRAGGGPVLREPAEMPWGERLAYVADPDGNPVALAAA
jgi:lactoylglutathione lyase